MYGVLTLSPHLLPMYSLLLKGVFVEERLGPQWKWVAQQVSFGECPWSPTHRIPRKIKDLFSQKEFATRTCKYAHEGFLNEIRGIEHSCKTTQCMSGWMSEAALTFHSGQIKPSNFCCPQRTSQSHIHCDSHCICKIWRSSKRTAQRRQNYHWIGTLPTHARCVQSCACSLTQIYLTDQALLLLLTYIIISPHPCTYMEQIRAREAKEKMLENGDTQQRKKSERSKALLSRAPIFCDLLRSYPYFHLLFSVCHYFVHYPQFCWCVS